MCSITFFQGSGEWKLIVLSTHHLKGRRPPGLDESLAYEDGTLSWKGTNIVLTAGGVPGALDPLLSGAVSSVYLP